MTRKVSPKKFPRFSQSKNCMKCLNLNSNSQKSKREVCYKPTFSHHCKICSECIARMDHHCPFISNCVGYSNHKFFVGLLSWGFFCTSLYLLEMLNYSLTHFQTKWGVQTFLSLEFFSMLAMFYAFLTIIFLLGLCFLLLIEHVRLILFNSTSIESTIIKSEQHKEFESKFKLRNLKRFYENFWLVVLPIKLKFKHEGFLEDPIWQDLDSPFDDYELEVVENDISLLGKTIEQIECFMGKGVEKKTNNIYLVDSYQFSD